MNTTAIATHPPSPPSPKTSKQPQPKQQTAKEAIAANVQALIEQLEQGHSEGLTAYLTAMGRFHNYCFGNILEIARQRPNATRVAGLYAWNQLGRKVKKGERGIRILAPVIGVRRKKDAEAEKGHPQSEPKPSWLGSVPPTSSMFRRPKAKTFPNCLSASRAMSGEYRERLLDFIAAQGIQLEFKESIAPALGHELRRQNRHPPRTGRSRRVQHACP